MSVKFEPVSPNFDFVANDKSVASFWRDNNIFKKSEQLNSSNPRYFVFYDGPPGPNGVPHIGHIMQSSLKDVFPRFKTMQGFTVLRKAGWDTHGLPIELIAESELGLAKGGKAAIEQYGIAKFVQYCRETVMRFRGKWVEAITKLGRFVDFEDDYLTMSNDFIQTDWWAIKQAFEKGLLYKDYKIVPYCCRCGTGLSSHELAQGYEDITDLTLTAKFPLQGEQNTYILAWTTTPWTLIGNTALALGAEIEYSKVKTTNAKGEEEFLILATAAIERNSKALGKDYKTVSTFLGKQLEGKTYTPLWDFSRIKAPGRQHEIIVDDYVTTEDGTGVVHLALYGEDDFRIIKRLGFVQNQHVGADGKFSANSGPYSGRWFREEGLDVEIVKDLAARGLLFDKYRYSHNYPHCWRCKTPLMYFAKSSWFLKTTAFKEQMIIENEKINWQPPHIRSGRFGNWLENNIDWAISRDRFWGSPIPIWSAGKNGEKKICVASVKELQNLGAYFKSSGEPVPESFDLHIPVIDDVVFKKDGEEYRRETGVLDCWFNAGVMPWGQFGYPAKEGSHEIFEKQFPADFICEAIDQTRGWFYTLLAVSCMLTGKSSFKNVICTELVLDAQGKKMSKSLGNVISPLPLIDKYGADAVRWTFYSTDPWIVKRYSEELPKEALRSIFIPIVNCYSFFVTYANLDGWTPRTFTPSPVEIDRWILSAFRSTTLEVSAALESYDISRAANAIYRFVDSLSNWYIRRSRKRFWRSENDADKGYAYSTLYQVLVDLSKLLAPMAPFLAENIYQNLVRSFNKDGAESVHLTSWIDPQVYKSEVELEEEIAVIQEAASLARSLRTEHDLKVRQPLSLLMITPANPHIGARLTRHLESLLEEINVKNIQIVGSSAEYVTVTVKPNWRALGPRFGKQMNALNAAIQKLNAAELSQISQDGIIRFTFDGNEIELNKEELEVQHLAKPGMVAQAGKLVTVALKTELTQDLIIEGHARELVSVIQRQRKNLNFEISDRIKAKIVGSAELKHAIEKHRDYISAECLADQLEFASEAAEGAENFNINGHNTGIRLERA